MSDFERQERVKQQTTVEKISLLPNVSYGFIIDQGSTLKIMTLLVGISALWFGLLKTSMVPSSDTLVKEAVYGLTELSRVEVKSYNPGCYPAFVQLPLVPLIKDFERQERMKQQTTIEKIYAAKCQLWRIPLKYDEERSLWILSRELLASVIHYALVFCSCKGYGPAGYALFVAVYAGLELCTENAFLPIVSNKKHCYQRLSHSKLWCSEYANVSNRV